MRAVLPGRPQPQLQAVCTGRWAYKDLILYITGNAVVVLDSPTSILQTIYDNELDPLEALSFDHVTGKIATCTARSLRIYSPCDDNDDSLRWALLDSVTLEAPEGLCHTLSWGTNGELLVGADTLALYATGSGAVRLWEKPLANPVRAALLSHDSAYIASCGTYDPLVKIWRRLSFGSDEVRFDLSYLSHDEPVASIQWRSPYHAEESVENVLYTVSVSKILRVWAATDVHGLHILQLCAQINLAESIQPRSLTPPARSVARYALMVSSSAFGAAVEQAIQNGESDTVSGGDLEHVIEIASRSPEVCLVFDENGQMSAWGVEGADSKSAQSFKIFNIINVSRVGLFVSNQELDVSEGLQFHYYFNRHDCKFYVLRHHYSGSIDVFLTPLLRALQPLQALETLQPVTVLTGHSAPIMKVVRNVSGSAVVTRTRSNEMVIWRYAPENHGRIRVQSMAEVKDHIHRICILDDGRYVALLHHETISLWDCRRKQSTVMGKVAYHVRGKPLCLVILPRTELTQSNLHIATVTSEMKGIVWQICLPQGEEQSASSDTIEEFAKFDLGDADDLAYVLPVDPAGSAPAVAGFLDLFARDVAISYSNAGLLRSWTARVDTETRKADWLLTASVDTGVNEPSLISGSSRRKAAVVDTSRSELTIWDLRSAQLEYVNSNSLRGAISDLDWTSTPDDQSILAVGSSHHITLVAQLRYDYLNAGPAWTVIREIDMRKMTPHPIGDSAWLSRGHLIVGAGNQLFIHDRRIEVTSSNAALLQLPVRKSGHWDLFEVVSRVNGPLPIFHPQYLSQCILVGKLDMVQQILLKLYKTLRHYLEGDEIDDLLGFDLEEFYLTPSDLSNSKISSSVVGVSVNGYDDEVESSTVTEDIASKLTELLSEVPVPQLSGATQMHLADIIECVAIVQKLRRSMDDDAARFLLFFRQYILHKGRTNKVQLSWREINWAFHSNSQDILLDAVNHHFHNKTLWEHARETGIFMWISDIQELKRQFEILARNEYTKGNDKSPVECSLYYFALGKKGVVQGLWRMSSGNKEQAATVKLLANNFEDPKYKTVAMKNAYALLGKHRYAYAAAFFLLAGCVKDAVNVCLNQLNDLQLAITIARVSEGDHGPVLGELLEQHVLPIAAKDGNRWLASWAFWMLQRRDMAVRALVSPVYTLLETPQSPNMDSKLYLTDDPALVVLYSQLRAKTLQTLRGASRITPKVEWEFVIHSARLYDRMGCDLLAIDLVRNWEFLLPGAHKGGTELEVNPKSFLRRRSSLVVADLPKDKSSLIAQGKGPHMPTFVEPDSNSLLDSFGF